MKKIKLFLGSSIDDLHTERTELESFVQSLNNRYIDRDIFIQIYACEETSGAMAVDGSQSVHDKFITDEADATFFMFFRKAGQFTLGELELARNTFLANKSRPNVFVFFKTIGTEIVDNDEIKTAVDKIANEYAHYYKLFEKSDTIKLEILQYIIDSLGSESELVIKDGNILVDNIQIDEISTNGIFAYENNSALQNLRTEIDNLKTKISESLASNNINKMIELSNTLKEKQGEYNKLETGILNILKSFYNENKSGNKADPIRMSALRLLEIGKVDEALAILPSLNQIKKDADRIIIQQNIIEENTKKVIEDAKIRINALKIKKITAASEEALWEEEQKVYEEIFEIYDSVYELAKSVNDIDFLYDFADYCERKRNDIEKSIEIVEFIKYIYSNPDITVSDADSQSLLGKLGLLYGENGETFKSEYYFHELINIYTKFAESEPDEPNHKKEIANVYNSFAFVCSGQDNFDKAEEYYLKAIDIIDMLDDSALELYLSFPFSNLANLYERHNKFNEAIVYCKKALAVLAKTSESTDKAEYEPQLAAIYNTLGNCYSDIEGYDEDSKEMHSKAKEIAERYCDKNEACAFLMASLSWK